MAEQDQEIIGYAGIDTTTDPLVLGRTKPNASVMSYNFRTKNTVRTLRGGWQPVLDLSQGKSGSQPTGRLRKAGIYFPDGAKAILPHTSIDYRNTFYLAGSGPVSIEFWMKSPPRLGERFVCKIPISYNIASSSTDYGCHMAVSFDTYQPYNYGGLMKPIIYLLLGNGITPSETLHNVAYHALDVFAEPDGKWHHYAFTRADGASIFKAYYDGVYQCEMHSTDINPEWDIALNATLKTESISPLMYNHLELGDSEFSLAEFRIWKEERSAQNIADNYETEISASSTNLVTYIKFNEGTGKIFKDSVTGDQGYFTPMEPYVNDDDELVFTGYNCLAWASLRSKWKADADSGDGSKLGSGAANFKNHCRDGCYEGGILWDTRLIRSTALYDPADEGNYQGTAQLRIRLHQLKEGMICGRLGMAFDSASNKYRLFLVDTGNSHVYMSDSVIDETWINTEKTITVIYYGFDSSATTDDEICKFYVDDTEVTDTSPTSTDWVWGNGDSIISSTYPVWEDIDHASQDEDEHPAAIGGSPVQPDMCVAFDLIFFRQWWGDHIGSGLSADDDFVSNTYNLSQLTDEYRYFMTNVSGFIVVLDSAGAGTQRVYIEDPTNTIGSMYNQTRQWLKMPFHDDSDTYDMPKTGKSYLWIDSGGYEKLIKQDVLIRHVFSFVASGSNSAIITPSGVEYHLKDCFSESASARYRYFSGGVISNLVNEYDAEAFRKKQSERYVFFERESTPSGYLRINPMKIYNTIGDKTPLQGIETIGAFRLDSRYLMLGTTTRSESIYAQEHLRPRWCIGPISPTTLPAVRCITRFKSSDGLVDGLYVVAWSGVYKLDPANQLVTPIEDWAWVDRNNDAPMNHISVNNRLVLMDDKSAIKMNWKENWSKLGIEWPVDIDLEETDTGTNLTTGERYAYVAQYYDSENNVYSGTIPVYNDQRQTVKILTDTSGIVVKVRSHKDNNVDRIIVYRTGDFSSTGTGTPTDLWIVKKGFNNKRWTNYNEFIDPWGPYKMEAAGRYIDHQHYGTTLVPPKAKAIAPALGRVFYGNYTNGRNRICWSQLDALGFPIPDQVNPTDSIILEEGSASDVTALQEYNGILIAFKDDAILRVGSTGPNTFASDLSYKGIGAVNQRCVVLAHNLVVFLGRNGIYKYSNGEPAMLSTRLLDYFRDEVDPSMNEKAFLLYHKKDDLILCFVPAIGSSYCDRCIILDLRTEAISIDIVPPVVCGYVDEDDIYLGGAYGQVFKYDENTYLDGVTSSIEGTGIVSSTTLSDTGVFLDDYSLVGAPVYVEDATNGKIWRGTIISHTADDCTVDAWEGLFNASGSPSGSLNYYVGHLFFYDKSPQYGIFNTGRIKTLNAIELMTDRMSSAGNLHFRLITDNSLHETVKIETIDGDRQEVKELGGLHKTAQFEYAGIIDEAFRVKGINLYTAWRHGRYV